MINIPPEDITLKTIVEAIEGKYCFSRCLTPDGECNRGASGNCQYQDSFAEITKMVSDKLESYNFRDLLASEKVKEKQV